MLAEAHSQSRSHEEFKYGCTIAELRSIVQEHMHAGIPINFVPVIILIEAQTFMTDGQFVRGNRFIERAKWVCSHMDDFIK